MGKTDWKEINHIDEKRAGAYHLVYPNPAATPVIVRIVQPA